MSEWIKIRKRHGNPQITDWKQMSDEQVVEILTSHGKQFCPLLRFEVTNTKGRYKLTDDKWSWSLYVTLDEMQTEECENPLEWVRSTFTRFNDCLESIRSGITTGNE